jgi:hypothetical protein
MHRHIVEARVTPRRYVANGVTFLSNAGRTCGDPGVLKTTQTRVLSEAVDCRHKEEKGAPPRQEPGLLYVGNPSHARYEQERRRGDGR